MARDGAELLRLATRKPGWGHRYVRNVTDPAPVRSTSTWYRVVPSAQSCRATTGACRHAPPDHTASAGRSPLGHVHTAGIGPSSARHGRACSGSVIALLTLRL
ncbi:hypothetical protein ACIP10_15425 [Streptomyces galbus]|uniref:hypothetical protein n=1 Tax=Streptomyces galbus TaxID=33898 RepID=UPI0037915FD9